MNELKRALTFPNPRVVIRREYRRARRLTLTRVRAAGARITSRPLIAHHGIQRSGTNYLRTLLLQSGYYVVNDIDPVRASPRHKHFRIQDDKSTITMDRAFANDVVVESVDALNAVAGYGDDMHHVVIFKEPQNWLGSIRRWGLTHGWMGEHDDFLAPDGPATRWLREWDAYHGKWFALAQQDPRVHVICYEDLIANPLTLMDDVHIFMGFDDARHLKDKGRVHKVAHSSARGASRSDAGSTDSPVGLVDSVVTSDWRRFVRERGYGIE